MKTYLLMLVTVLTAALNCRAQTADSAYTLKATPRLNSAGYFPFTGALLNRNVNCDLDIVFQKRGYGFLAFKSVDLQDSETDINYLQSALFRQFTLSRSVSTVLYAGYLFSQIHGFRDEAGSDYFGAWAMNWRASQKLRVENIMLYNDFSTQFKIVNRLRVSYTLGDFRLDLSCHQRYVPETGNISASSALAVNLPKAKIAKRIDVQASIMYQSYLTSERPGFAMKNGVLFSLAFPMDLSGL